MLPELLFSVGSSMQDFSKDDYNFLNGACDKDASLVANETALERIKLAKTPDLIEAPESIKLEDSSIYSWHTATNLGSNLLKSSDDPLISGVTQDRHNDCSEFTIARPQSKSPLSPEAPCTLPKTTKKPAKTRRKPQFKLRFHHQALPAAYLDHYEATQHRNEPKKPAPEAQKTNETVRNWLQKLNEAQKETQKDAEMAAPNTKPSKIVSYKDLPYMGEMTLDNSKPRRGRKPKKADICHLIYKNYGTIFPDNPRNVEATEPKKQQNEPLNLCIRDTSDTLIVSSSEEDDSNESSRTNTPLLKLLLKTPLQRQI